MSTAALLESPKLHAVHAPAPRDLLRSLGLAFQARAMHTSLDSLIEMRENQAQSVMRALVALVSRTAQQPAMSSVPAWAGSLVEPAVQAFLDLVRDEGSVALQLPFARYTFNGQKLRVPQRRLGSTPDLGGAWRSEGEPIRIGGLSLTSATMEAKTLAVIATASNETVNRAGDDVLMEVVRAGIATDTMKVLDAAVFDNAPGSEERPAGLQTYATGSNTAVSSGTTAAQIAADLRARLDALLAAGYGGPRTRWAMSTGRAATLAAEFIEVQVRGTYLGLPIVSGHAMPSDVVFLVDGAGIAFGADAPVVDTTSDALLHEEGDPAAVRPLVDGTGVVAAPARSLFQTNASALRMVLPVDWTAAPGAVQTLIEVAW